MNVYTGNIDGKCEEWGTILTNSWKRAAQIAGRTLYSMRKFWACRPATFDDVVTFQPHVLHVSKFRK